MNTPLDKKEAQGLLPLDVTWVQELTDIVGNEQAERAGVAKTFTGLRVAKGDPEKYRRIVMERTKMGMTVREVAALERVSPQTVRAIMLLEQRGKKAEEYREETSAELAVAVGMTVGRITECLEDDERMKQASPRDLAYLLKELTEKRELLSGGATHRGENVETPEQAKDRAMKHAEQADALLGQLKDFEEAEIVEVNDGKTQGQ